MLIVDAQVHILVGGAADQSGCTARSIPIRPRSVSATWMPPGSMRACCTRRGGYTNSGEISEEAAAKYPNRFGILGNFPLDKPERPIPDRRLEEAAGHARVALCVHPAAPGQTG